MVSLRIPFFPPDSDPEKPIALFGKWVPISDQ